MLYKKSAEQGIRVSIERQVSSQMLQIVEKIVACLRKPKLPLPICEETPKADRGILSSGEEEEPSEPEVRATAAELAHEIEEGRFLTLPEIEALPYSEGEQPTPELPQ